MRRYWTSIRHGQPEDRGLFWLTVTTLLGSALVIWFAWGDAVTALTGLQVVLAFIAAVAAGLAFKATWPQYKAFTARPDIELSMQWAESVSHKPEPAPAHVIFSADSFIVRAVVHNKGPGTLRNGCLNIIAPSLCDLEVLDPDKTHYVSPMVDSSLALSGDGTLREVRFTVARDDFFPGAHVYHVRVTPMHKSKGPWPVVLDLSGDAVPHDDSRSVRRVFAHAQHCR